MNYTLHDTEILEQLRKIYNKLEQLPPDKRSIVVLMTEAFINGMVAASGKGVNLWN